MVVGGGGGSFRNGPYKPETLISSSTGRLLALLGTSSWRQRRCSYDSGCFDTSLLRRHLVCVSTGLQPCNPLDRPRYPVEPPPEVGDVNQREEQCRNPERMDMSEQSNETQHGNNLEPHFAGPMRHSLG